jgi:hypothetical protein
VPVPESVCLSLGPSQGLGLGLSRALCSQARACPCVRAVARGASASSVHLSQQGLGSTGAARTTPLTRLDAALSDDTAPRDPDSEIDHIENNIQQGQPFRPGPPPPAPGWPTAGLDWTSCLEMATPQTYCNGCSFLRQQTSEHSRPPPAASLPPAALILHQPECPVTAGSQSSTITTATQRPRLCWLRRRLAISRVRRLLCPAEPCHASDQSNSPLERIQMESYIFSSSVLSLEGQMFCTCYHR